MYGLCRVMRERMVCKLVLTRVPIITERFRVGSYSGAGYLNVNRTASGKVTNYARWLDMDTAVLKTTWTEPGSSFNRQVQVFRHLL